MSTPMVLFAILAGLTAASALGVLIHRGVVRSALSLLFTLVGVSMLYFLLGAEFLGAAQLIVYVGGTLVLVVFGGMLTESGPFAGPKVRGIEWILGGAVALVLFLAIVGATLELSAPPPSETPPPSVAELGLGFLGVTQPGNKHAFLFPFEIVSVHLLVVLIGAAYLARAKRRRTSAETTV
ncbi:MAG: NADH-quinone oxidoreductase subunit J family protein [Fimbriiglobus sp.]